MMNDKFKTQDNWEFNGGDLAAELKGALTVAAKQPDMFIGLPCHACWPKEKTDWFIQTFNIPNNHVTYANIVCNANWKLFMSYLIGEKIPLNHIGPGSCHQNELNIVDHFKVDELLLNSWDTKKVEFMEKLENWIGTKISDKPKIFTFSVGPLTKVIIPYLANKYSGHFYIDVGSAFDYFLKGQTNRGYVNPADNLHYQVCSFINGHKGY